MTAHTLTEQPLFTSLRQEIEGSWEPLPDKPEETPELTLRALWFAAAGSPCSVAASAEGVLPTLCDDEIARLRILVERRRAGEPLAYITGRQRFMDLEMLAAPAALIPRRETELLGAAAIRILDDQRADGERLAIDVCTGSGNVALALAAHDPLLRVVAADLSAEAVELARRNAAYLGLADRVTFFESDLFEALDRSELHETVDLITCNPPYISSAKVPEMAAEISRHEPRLAFDGGAFGLSVILRLISGAPRFLRPGGWLCFEVGARNGAQLAGRLTANKSYDDVGVVKDDAGAVRVLLARKR